MNGHLITSDGTSHEVTSDNVKRMLDSSIPFWLDLDGLDQSGTELLRETFGFHPLAIEDVEHFGQRPKIDTYDDFVLLVVYGATAESGLIEVHCFYSQAFLVTVHRAPCADLAALAERLGRRTGGETDHVMLLYRALDTLVDTYFPVLARFDDEIDELEDQILERPTDEQLGRLFDMKRSLIALRKVVTPQRDMFASLLGAEDVLAGMTADAERYFRDLYDHLIRVSDLVDSYRDLMSGAMDTHISTVSNRLNVVMKQLTIIATVFLPLSFLTGFFGQNFGWMVTRMSGLPVFLGVAIGVQILVVVALIVLFRVRGWLGSDGTVPPSTPARRHRVPASQRWLHLHRPSVGGSRLAENPGGA
jgi:magnesium transporter